MLNKQIKMATFSLEDKVSKRGSSLRQVHLTGPKYGTIFTFLLFSILLIHFQYYSIVFIIIQSDYVE